MAQPMYQQIADDLRRQIEIGALRPGEQLPTELDLREKYEASRNTIRDAIKRLLGAGLVETRPGQGTFVVDRINPFVMTMSADLSGSAGGEGATYLSEAGASHRKAVTSSPKVGVRAPGPEIAVRLRVEEGSQVISRYQERFIDDRPWSLQTSYYPIGFIQDAPRLLMADDIQEGAVKYLEKVKGIKQTGYRDWITARAPDQNEQAFFSLPHDAAVFEVFRTAFDQTGQPLRLTVTVCPVDRNQFLYNVGDVPAPSYVLPEPEPEQETKPEPGDS